MTEQDRFFFYSQSRDVLPGHGANERGDPNHYKSLSSIRFSLYGLLFNNDVSFSWMHIQ